MKILLNTAKSVKNTNIDNYANVELVEETRQLAEDQHVKNIDEYEQYVNEKDACTNYRLSFVVNPVCSNVLFNRVSEITYHEGGDDCVEIGCQNVDMNDTDSIKAYHKDYLNDSKRKLNRYQMTRDTSYSSSKIGPFVYHCGYDIFNNHFLRQKEFATVSKLNSVGESNFNTLTDYVRDENGNRVKEKRRSYGATGATKPIHLYQYDTVKSFSAAIQEGLVEDENGWWGFKNVATMPVKNFYEETFNRTMCNNKPYEQYDMYPDRSLYSILPKYNKYRDRYEDNWEFCLTYPSESVSNEVTENGLKCELIKQVTDNDDEARFDRTLMFRSDVFHNLSRFTPIEMTFGGQRYKTNVFSLGDETGGNTGYYFSVPYEDIKEGVKYSDNLKNIRFSKIVNGGKCKYYFRIFKKIPKENTKDVYYRPQVNRLGFGQTYYGDESAELLFNRDVVVKGLKDNLGRELSEIYLTVLKTNKGHEKWYEEKNKTDVNIEFSHCFGKISSGMDLLPQAKDYNIHAIHNVKVGEGCTEDELNFMQIPQSSKAIEDDITPGNDSFYGDLVEFSPNTVEETVLEYVYHRFNTAQREYTKDNEYRDIYHEEIITDDDDITAQGPSELKTEKKVYNTIDGTSGNTYPVNVAPEGYYYNPHYLLKLKEFSTTVQQGNDIKLIFLSGSERIDDHTMSGRLSRNYGIAKGETVLALYDGKQHECVVEEVGEKNAVVFRLRDDADAFPQQLLTVSFFRINPLKPQGAYDLNDGTGRYLWRAMLSTKELSTNSSLYDSIFTNGAIYIHRNLNLYLRRQDPFGFYGLNNIGKIGLPQHMEDMNIGGSSYDYKTIEYVTENTTQQC